MVGISIIIALASRNNFRAMPVLGAAGADAVVATLWPISAPTIPLVEGFHATSVKGMDAGAALRAAKLDLIRKPGSTPVFWASMIVMHEGI